jgi:hypothetical protein
MIHETNINDDFKQQNMWSLHMNHYDYFQKHVVITFVRIQTHVSENVKINGVWSFEELADILIDKTSLVC